MLVEVGGKEVVRGMGDVGTSDMVTKAGKAGTWAQLFDEVAPPAMGAATKAGDATVGMHM